MTWKEQGAKLNRYETQSEEQSASMAKNIKYTMKVDTGLYTSERLP